MPGRSITVEPGDVLTVVWRGSTIGWVDVDESYPTHLFGWFRAAPGHAEEYAPFDEALALSRLYDETADEAERSAIYDRERTLNKARAATIRFLEYPVEIEDFAIHHSGEAEVTWKPANG